MHNRHDPRVLPPKDGLRPSCLVIPNAGQIAAVWAHLHKDLQAPAQAQAATQAPSTPVGLLRPTSPKVDLGRGQPPCALHTPHGHCASKPVPEPATTLQYLAAKIPAVSHSDWLARMACGEVVAETGQRITPHTPLLHGLRIYYYRAVSVEPPMPFVGRILFEDAHIVVADKPHFLPVTPCGRAIAGTLLVQLQRKLGCDTLSPVHRIDRDTAGIVIFAKHRAERGAYQALFRQRQVAKTYEAIAPYRADLFADFQTTLVRHTHIAASGHFIRMHEVPDRAPNALTHITLIEHNARWARYALRPTTGQRHQLRVHMAALGMGICGDGLYPEVADMPEGDFSRALRLLARSIAFADPITGEQRHFDSRLSLGELPRE